MIEIAWPYLLGALLTTLLLQFIRSYYIGHLTRKFHGLLDWAFDISHFRDFSRLAQELLELRRSLKNTSAMDEFSKWAKLNRQCTKKESEFESLHKKRQMDVLKFQLSYKILFYLLALALELAVFLWNYPVAVVRGLDLVFPLKYLCALPLRCTDCISFWTVYLVLFVTVYKTLPLLVGPSSASQQDEWAVAPATGPLITDADADRKQEKEN